MKLIERFELDVTKVKGAQEKYDYLYSHVDPTELGLAVEKFRDPVLEARLARTLSGYPAVRVIPEPYSRLALEAHLKVLFADPMMLPRDPAVKKADAKAAVEFLRLMAIGDIPGYDLRSVEPELRAALGVPELASPAVDALERFKSGETQIALLQLALSGDGKPAGGLGAKATDAVIRHIRAYGERAVPETLAGAVLRSGRRTAAPGRPARGPHRACGAKTPDAQGDGRGEAGRVHQPTESLRPAHFARTEERIGKEGAREEGAGTQTLTGQGFLSESQG